MTEDERLDLEALRPDPEDRDRVISGAMARIRGEAEPGWARTTLEASARFLRPVLAAAAIVALLLLLPGRSPHPDTQTAGVLLQTATNVPDNWLRWSVGGERPDPREILVLYTEPTP